MPRRISVEERIKRLEAKKEFVIKQRVDAFERRIRALYDAKIDLLREKGLKSKEKAHNIKNMVMKARERYVFFRTRFYERMGLSRADATAKAEADYENYRRGFMRSMQR